ncbi:MAG: metallophosphoesterase family protein [Stappiaceae bacterium]
MALISDIHGNDIAFEAVMSAIQQEDVDQIVCLGDVATLGPDPVQAIARLRALGCRCIMGNHDEFLLDHNLLDKYTNSQLIRDAVDWCREKLSPDDIAFLRSFERYATLDLGDEQSLMLFHGTPRSHMENLLATTPPEELDNLLGEHRASVMAGGHTHVQMLRQHRGYLIVNAGSVGQPFKEFADNCEPVLMPHFAEYGIVDADRGNIRITLRRVPIDCDKVRQRLDDPTFPMLDFTLRQFS